MSDAELNASSPQPPSVPVMGNPRPARAGGSSAAPDDGVKTRPTPQYLTASEVAELLQVDPASVYRWAAQDGSMPATRVGGVVRFHPAALDRWLASKTQRSRRS
jgi:excisionase family DNA binding protein